MSEAAPASPGRNTVAGPTLVALAVGCGITVGNVYLCQPLLAKIALDLGVSEGSAGLVAVAAQAGYALGILLVLPLADAVDPRRLVGLLLILTAASLGAAALAPTVALLIVASLAIASATVVPQILIPVTSGFADPRQRGRVIGVLQTGLILGILLSRTIAGGLAEALDTWRAPYLLAALLTAGLASFLPGMIPLREARPSPMPYLGLLRSLVPLMAIRPLRLSMALGFCVFASFSAIWATLSFHLAGEAFGLGPATAGLFGLYGAPGALLAPVAGRLSDRFGSAWINAAALVAVAIAFALAGTVGAFSLVALVVAVNLLDFGLQSGQVANQVRIFGLGDEIRGRLNTLYMVATFGGGAFGSLAGTFAWSVGGWRAVCALCLALAALAAVALAFGARSKGAAQKQGRDNGNG